MLLGFLGWYTPKSKRYQHWLTSSKSGAFYACLFPNNIYISSFTCWRVCYALNHYMESDFEKCPWFESQALQVWLNIDCLLIQLHYRHCWRNTFSAIFLKNIKQTFTIMFNNIRDLHLIYTSPRVWRLLCGQANESNDGARSIRNSISKLSCIHVLYKMSCILENYRASLCDGFYYVVLNIVAKHMNYHYVLYVPEQEDNTYFILLPDFC